MVCFAEEEKTLQRAITLFRQIAMKREVLPPADFIR